MNPLISLLLIAIGASSGAIIRYAFFLWFERIHIATYHATVTVNIVGSFLIGIMYVIISNTQNNYLQLLFITGLLSSFTTFSSLSLASVELIQRRAYYTVLLTLSLQIIFGLGACFFGIKVSEYFLKNSS